MVSKAYKNIHSLKNKKTEEIIGCSFVEFKEYIDSLKVEWMTDDNYGQYIIGGDRTWQIDHIIPISSAETEEDVIRLNHYTNLRPLCSKENLDKRDKLI